MIAFPTPAPVAVAHATGDAARSTVPAASGSSACTQCDGNGILWGYRTHNPSERESSFDCPHCGGSGSEPAVETEESEDE